MISLVSLNAIAIPERAIVELNSLELNLYCGMKKLNTNGVNFTDWETLAKSSRIKSYVTLSNTVKKLTKKHWAQVEWKKTGITFTALDEPETPKTYATLDNGTLVRKETYDLIMKGKKKK